MGRSCDLFGGTCVISVIEGFVDVSRLRDVPDNQEVFIDLDGNCSLIIEILEMEKEVEEGKISHYFFEDLASQNGDKNFVITETGLLDSSHISIADRPSIVEYAIGTMRIARRDTDRAVNEQDRLVQTFLAVIRIPSVTSDIAISYTFPKTRDNVDPDSLSLFKSIVSSFKILDWDLF